MLNCAKTHWYLTYIHCVYERVHARACLFEGFQFMPRALTTVQSSRFLSAAVPVFELYMFRFSNNIEGRHLKNFMLIYPLRSFPSKPKQVRNTFRDSNKQIFNASSPTTLATLTFTGLVCFTFLPIFPQGGLRHISSRSLKCLFWPAEHQWAALNLRTN